MIGKKIFPIVKSDVTKLVATGLRAGGLNAHQLTSFARQEWDRRPAPVDGQDARSTGTTGCVESS